jgi:opacity protein-like surface antigen
MRQLMIFAALALLVAGQVSAATVEDLRKEVDALRKELIAKPDTAVNPIGRADALVESKYGPNAPVATKSGKLTIGATMQIWYRSIQNDNRDWTDQTQLGGDGGQNETFDNDTFQLRRIILKFGYEINKNISGLVLVDTAIEPNSWPPYPQNQGGTYLNSARGPAAAQGGTGVTPLFLLDAWINYHDVVPRHDFRIGQFKRKMGDEGSRPSDFLDFVDRAFISQISHISYDIGFEGHGAWVDDRIQYWFGVQNGTATALTVPRFNRSDDNDEKNFFGAIQVRPVWKNEKWGSLEFSYSAMSGVGGEAANHTPGDAPVNGLNRRDTSQFMHYATAKYLPGGPVKGWWLLGEWAQFRDRFAPNQVRTGDANFTTNPAPFEIDGWYISTGYRLCDSIFAKGLPKWAKPIEFTYRYESFRNLFYHDLVTPERKLDVFKTTVNTAGINYNFKGHNAKIMLNYNWVNEEDEVDNDVRQVREVRNNNLAVQFQVSF